ncbi:hypothetical protein Bxe_B0718 [Paraburkholderia xenovorans LB400]|uniref:Uncharacterized protein n=1 Tax=Paraburkholderia xenovorans (strain LB400) TaxID=266265 RepID=Q13L03_PARXL|nr:hypothetical protein Bxe_B0718 [Paraburkholderia xenovorans LB400]
MPNSIQQLFRPVSRRKAASRAALIRRECDRGVSEKMTMWVRIERAGKRHEGVQGRSRRPVYRHQLRASLMMQPRTKISRTAATAMFSG